MDKRNFFGKKTNLTILFVIAIIVWVSNGYRLFKGVVKNDSLENQTLGVKSDTLITEIDKRLDDWQYPKGKRDPFVLATIAVKSKPKVVQVHKKLMQKPMLRLTGIVMDDNEKVAVIEKPDRNVLFLKEGELLDSLKIVQIDERSIRIQCKKETFTYTL